MLGVNITNSNPSQSEPGFLFYNTRSALNQQTYADPWWLFLPRSNTELLRGGFVDYSVTSFGQVYAHKTWLIPGYSSTNTLFHVDNPRSTIFKNAFLQSTANNVFFPNYTFMDGETPYSPNDDTDTSTYQIFFNGKTYLASQANSDTSLGNDVYLSVEGYYWDEKVNVLPGGKQWYYFDYDSNNNVWLGFATDGSISASTDDGHSWTSRTATGLASSPYGIISSGNDFWVAANLSSIAYSTDGGNAWNQVNISNSRAQGDVKGVIYDGIRWHAFGGRYNGTQYDPNIWTSDDGQTWTNATANIDTPSVGLMINAMAEGDGRVVAGGFNYYGNVASFASTDTYLYSDDGINWTTKTTPYYYISSNQQISYGGGQYVSYPNAGQDNKR